MNHPTFWAAFEEASDELIADCAMKTETRAREEPDQRDTSLCGPTKTAKSTREQDDQDAGPRGLSTFPKALASQTQTITKTREESDQDPVRSGFATVPRITMTETQTLTEVREGPDQDAPGRRLAAIPRASEVHG